MCRAGSRSGNRAGWLGCRGGLTLIELMVVVAVMAVLAAAVAPTIVSATRRLGLDRASVEVQDLLDYAAAAAIARRQLVTVRFDAERGACWACLQSAQLPWLSEQVQVGPSVLVGVRLPDGVSVALVDSDGAETASARRAEWDAIRFWPDGTADEVSVGLSDARGERELLDVRPLVGEVVLIEKE